MSDQKAKKLTKEQEAQLPIYRDYWTRIGLMPLEEREKEFPLTDDELQRIISDVYTTGELTPPKTIVKTGSLMSAVLFIGIMNHLNETDDSDDDTPEGVIDKIYPSVKDMINDLIGDSINDEAAYNIESFARSALNSSLWGCYDAGWCGWAAFMDEVLKVEGAEKSKPLRDLAHHTGFIFPYEDVCVVSLPHKEIHRNDQGELHNEDGPAVIFPDGYSIYSIDGHIFPGWIAEEPEKITPEIIQEEQNAETRRIMINHYPGGTGKYLQDIGARVIDVDQVPVDALDPKGLHISRALIKTNIGDRFLVGTDGSTSRTYYMPLPEDEEIKTCKEAHQAISPFNLKDSAVSQS